VSNTPLYVGIDLGTTNSAAAVFDGEGVSVVRNAQGATVTPSVVRVDKQGRITVGTRARRFLEQDPANTAAEFKRLMGTERAIEFPAAGKRIKPEELSAEILKALRQDIQDQLGRNDFARLRFGIGRPPAGEDPVAYVLAPFAADEQAQLGARLDAASDAIEWVLAEGVPRAMNRVNAAPVVETPS
jgi:hypothetical protein